MSSLGEKISFLRKKKKLTQTELAQLINTGRVSISQWENDKVKPDTNFLTLLAKELDTSVAYLMGEEKIDLLESNGRIIEDITMVPVISSNLITACCGNGTVYATDIQWEIDKYYPIPSEDLIGYGWQGAQFYLIVAEGVSMEPYIFEGDMILFATGVDVKAGDIAVISMNNRVFCKGIVERTADHILFRSYNYQVSPDLRVEIDENNEVLVLGKVLRVITQKTLPRFC